MDDNNPAAALPSVLAGHPWRKHTAKLENPPTTMLMQQELNLLHWLTSTYYRGEGSIIDGGCFLGGSTYALASGLAENSSGNRLQRPIHSYDMFSTVGELWFDWLAKYGLQKDESFEDKFRQNVGAHLDRVEIHAGNLLAQSWGDAPIEILFLDICKSPQLHDHATRMWFPRLIPGRSVVIQQDYGWWNYYWGNVMMEVFQDHFTTLDDVPVASRVYLCTKAISEAEAAEKVFAHVSTDDKLRHMEAALKSVGQSEFRGYLLLNYAYYAVLGTEGVAQSKLVAAAHLVDITLEVAAQTLRAGVVARRRALEPGHHQTPLGERAPQRRGGARWPPRRPASLALPRDHLPSARRTTLETCMPAPSVRTHRRLTRCRMTGTVKLAAKPTKATRK
jgi:hypothetical protein